MTSASFVDLKKSQDEYFDIINQYRSLFEQGNIPLKEITFILDEIKCFWLERLELIEFTLEDLTAHNSCFLLSGAIYLNVGDLEHYYFKSLGDYHLISDPFLRTENFFRAPENRINSKETTDYFEEAYIDTITVLTKYRYCFFILPTREIAIKDEPKHYQLLNTFFFGFLSTVLGKKFSRNEDFCDNYKCFEEIENDMDDYVREHLRYTNTDEIGLSLREKIERCCQTQMNFNELIKGQSEPQIFLISTYSWISQIIEILLVCTRLNVCPYIRFDVTFHYLSLLMHSFIEDKNLKEMIEKTILFYILRKTIKEETFANIEFNDYCRLIKSRPLLDVLIGKMHTLGIDVCKGGIKQVQSIITKEFDKNIFTSK